MSRASFKANRAASLAAWEASLSTPIPPWHPSQYEPGEPHPEPPVERPRSRALNAMIALALLGAPDGIGRRSRR